MSRDHRKLRVFEDAHQLTLAVYRHTREFPKDEWFGIRVQMRRAAVSSSSNIVEGSARPSTRDYLRFCNISLGSACELKYLASLSQELGFVEESTWSDVTTRCDAVVRQLQRLVQALEKQLAAESIPVARSPKPAAPSPTPRSPQPEAVSPQPEAPQPVAHRSPRTGDPKKRSIETSQTGRIRPVLAFIAGMGLAHTGREELPLYGDQ